MAGSWSHIVASPPRDATGRFAGVRLLDNLGDAYEALEECYGMVWWLARGDAAAVQEAMEKWQLGIQLSPGVVGEDEQLDDEDV